VTLSGGKLIAVAVAVLALVAGWLAGQRQGRGARVRAEAVADSLLRSARADSLARAQLRMEADRWHQEADRARERTDSLRAARHITDALAWRAIRRADSVSQVADSLTALATAHDSIVTYRDAWAAEREAAGRLKASLAMADQQIASQQVELDAVRAEADSLRKEADLAGERIRVVTLGLDTLRQVTRCRIAGLLPCPSRGVMFVAGAALGVTVAAVVN
jgi:hypothetical protein